MWHDLIKPLLITAIISAILVSGLFFLFEIDHEKKFNNGVCQVCGEDVMPIGHAYSTSYYCSQCKRYNE